MSGATPHGRSEAGSGSIPWAISGFGLCSTGFFVGWCLWFRSLLDLAAVGVAFSTVAVPALALVWAGYRLARSGIGADRYGRILQWCVGGAIVSLSINGLVIAFFPWPTLAGTVSWIHWSVNVGTGVGLLVGYVEARAIQREVEATAAAVRAEQLEEDRELLTYLNDLLRHEVLNSTQIISGHASLLLEETDDPTPERERERDRDRDRLETIARESEALTEVIDDIRAMLTATQTSEFRAAVDLGAVLREELTRLERQFDDVIVEATVPNDLRVDGNEGIRWIFANVLENAVEHNDSDPARVEVTVTTTAETATVWIADDGPGIPAAVRETLFERRSENHGLGLYLTRILATRYGGSVELAETGPDGTAFTVTLSRADGERPTEPTDRDQDRRRIEGEPSVTDERPLSGTGTRTETAFGADAGTETEPNDSPSGFGSGPGSGSGST